MKYDIIYTARFKRDIKAIQKRHYDLQLLEAIVDALAAGETIPALHRDHELKGNWVGHRECHITPDWLLVYRIDAGLLVLTLTRTGTHSDLF